MDLILRPTPPRCSRVTLYYHFALTVPVSVPYKESVAVFHDIRVVWDSSTTENIKFFWTYIAAVDADLSFGLWLRNGLPRTSENDRQLVILSQYPCGVQLHSPRAQMRNNLPTHGGYDGCARQRDPVAVHVFCQVIINLMATSNSNDVLDSIHYVK